MTTIGNYPIRYRIVYRIVAVIVVIGYSVGVVRVLGSLPKVQTPMFSPP